MALPWRLAFCIGCGFFSEDFYPRDQRLQTTCVPESLSCQARSRNCNLAQDYLRLLNQHNHILGRKEVGPESFIGIGEAVRHGLDAKCAKNLMKSYFVS